MSKIDWNDRPATIALGLTVVALLCAVCFIFGRDSGKSEVEPYNHTQHYAERSDIQIENICASKSTKEEAIKCAIEAKTQSRDAKREEHDLNAQKSMAQWAWWMILVTGIVGLMTFGVTAVGVWFVRDTLIATSDAVKAANKTNEIMVSGQRAWMEPIPIDKGALKFDEGRISVHICPIFMNCGNSVAQNVIVVPEIIDVSSGAESISFETKRIWGNTIANVVFPTKPTTWREYDTVSVTGNAFENAVHIKIKFTCFYKDDTSDKQRSTEIIYYVTTKSNDFEVPCNLSLESFGCAAMPGTLVAT